MGIKKGMWVKSPARYGAVSIEISVASVKAGHWETEKAMETQDKIHKRESEDLRGL